MALNDRHPSALNRVLLQHAADVKGLVDELGRKVRGLTALGWNEIGRFITEWTLCLTLVSLI